MVVGLSGLLVLGYGGFYAIGAYTFALLNHYYGLGFWTCLPLAGLVSPQPRASCWGSRYCVCAATIWRSSRLASAKSSVFCCLITPKSPVAPTASARFQKPTLFGLEFSRSAREGGWDTFSNFFGLKYDPGDRMIFLYLVALLLVVLSLFVINRLLRMPLGRAWKRVA